MKHVFVVHSHTTFLISIATIKKLSIDTKDVILLFGRKYSISVMEIPYKVCDIDSIYYPIHNGFFFLISRKKQDEYARKVDNFIEENIKDDFSFYTPHTGFALFQLFLTNSKCKHLNLIQEAALSCFNKSFNAKSGFKNLLVFFNKRIWYQSNWNLPRNVYKKFPQIFTFSQKEDYWKPIQNAEHITVDIPIPNININFDKSKPIFVFEASVEHKQIEKEIFMSECKNLINDYKDEINYVKFHPAQIEENKKQIISFFGNTKVEELPMDIPFELILCSYKNLKVFGFSTSLVVYAYDMGHNVICRAKKLGGKSKLFQKYLLGLGITEHPVYNKEY